MIIHAAEVVIEVDEDLRREDIEEVIAVHIPETGRGN